MILGLDISTVVIGLSIMDNKKLIHTDYFDLKSDLSLSSNKIFNKIRIWLTDIKSKYNIDKIYIEEPMKKLSNGKTSISILASIFKVNYTVCWLCYDIFGFDINYITSTSARTKMKISIKTPLKRNFIYYSATKDIKKVALERVLEEYPDFEKQLTFSKNGIILEHNLDIVDAIVVSYYG